MDIPVTRIIHPWTYNRNTGIVGVMTEKVGVIVGHLAGSCGKQILPGHIFPTRPQVQNSAVNHQALCAKQANRLGRLFGVGKPPRSSFPKVSWCVVHPLRVLLFNSI